MTSSSKSHSADLIINLLTKQEYNNRDYIHLPRDHLTAIVHQATAIFKQQPIFLLLGTPVSICGDIHGQFQDLIRIFQSVGYPPSKNYLFLGDYVDRGKHSVATIALLLAYKIKYPENFFLLRGNHECAVINRLYGFYGECKRYYDIKL